MKLEKKIETRETMSMGSLAGQVVDHHVSHSVVL